MHYVPVAEDLRDLKQKFDWLESNPHFAKRIADQATQLAQYLGSVEGFQRLFQEEFIEPFRRAIEAYQPVSMINPNATWEDVLKSDGKGFIIKSVSKGPEYV